MIDVWMKRKLNEISVCWLFFRLGDVYYFVGVLIYLEMYI